MLFHRNLLLLYGFSGILLGIGFVLPVLWMFGLLGVALFVYCLNRTEKFRVAIWGGFLAWTIKSMFAISWFLSTYPISWIELSLGKAELLVVIFYWLTVSVFLGLGGLVVALLCWSLKKYLFLEYGFLLFPFVWVVGEIFSSLSFSIWTFGEGGTINTVFSFGYLGYLLGNNELLLRLSVWGGVYILSFLGSLLGYFIWFLDVNCTRLKTIAVIGIFLSIIVISSLGFSQAENNTELAKTKVAIVDTQFTATDFIDPAKQSYIREQLSRAIESALSLDTAYIVLPEDIRFTDSQTPPETAYRLFRFQSSDSDSVLIDSGRFALSSDKATLRAVIYDGVGKKSWTVDKKYLVPQGEFMPYFNIASLNVIGAGTAAGEISKKLGYVPGPLVDQSSLANNIPAILFCFESADPLGVKRLVSEREVPFVAHPISHAWFHESKILWQQQDLMLKIQALWSGVNIVSAGNMAHGALYTSKGKKIKPTPVVAGESWQISLVSW